jgi:hypothetical protein
MNLRNKHQAIYLTPDKISRYLTHKNWFIDGKIGDVATIWHHNKNFYFELILPDNTNILDFNDRINDLLLNLAKIEKRKVELIIDDINNYFTDQYSVRVIHSDVDDGTIPLDDGVLLIEKTKDLITSAALATLNKKKVFSGNRPQEANEYLNKIRLGQTEIGSFIIKIISPIEISSVEQKDENLVSFTRSVTTTLSKSLKAICEAIEKYNSDGELLIFSHAVNLGVSANLCEALIGLSGSNKTRDFEINISLSHGEIDTQQIKVNHRFNSKHVEVLKIAAEYYKDNFIIRDYKVSGIVKKLSRDLTDDTGLITVETKVHEKSKSVSIELLEDDYLEAIHAHENKHIIECIGDLHVSPRSAKLLAYKNFITIKNGELF